MRFAIAPPLLVTRDPRRESFHLRLRLAGTRVPPPGPGGDPLPAAQREGKAEKSKKGLQFTSALAGAVAMRDSVATIHTGPGT